MIKRKLFNLIYVILSVILISFLTSGCVPSDNNEENASQSTSSQVTSSSSGVSTILITPEYSKVTTNGGDTGTTRIVIRTLDSSGKGVSTTLNVSATLGSITDSQGNLISRITTNSYGYGEFYFVSGQNPGKASIIVSEGALSNSTEIDVVKIGVISLVLDKQYLLEGESTLLHVNVKDIFDEPVEGIRVKLSSENDTALSLGLDTLVTDENGSAKVFVTAGEISQNTQVKVNASCGGRSAETTVKIAVPVAIILNPVMLSESGETVAINAQVIGKDGKGIPQVQIAFSTTLGEISPSVATTDNMGRATVYLYSKNLEGKALITATVANISNQTEVYIKSSTSTSPALIEVESVETDKIYVKGSGKKETSKVIFKVVDEEGNPVKNVAIKFSLIGGSSGGEFLSPVVNVSDENGEVMTTLHAGILPGVVKIKAWYNDRIFTETEAITISSGPPEGRHFSLAFDKLNIPGLIYDGIQDGVSARLADFYGNPVPEGTGVHFECEYAKVEGANATDGEEPGLATAYLYSQDPRPVNGAPVHVWAQTQSGAYAHITKIYADNDTILIGTDGGGVFKSIDMGISWENIGKPRTYSEGLKGLWGTYVEDMDVLKNTNTNLIVVATEKGVFYSEDGGYNWRDLSSHSDRYIDYFNLNGTTLTANLTYYPIPNLARIWITVNGIPIEDTPVKWKVENNTFFVNTPGNYTVSYDIDYNSPSAPAKLVKILNSTVFFACFQNTGLFKFNKQTLRWEDFNKNLTGLDISTIALVDTNADGKKDTIFVTVDGSVFKSSVANPYFQLVKVFPVSFNDVYVKDSKLYYATTEGIKIYDSTTNTWEEISLEGAPTRNVKKVVVTSNGTIFAGTDYGLYKVTSTGAIPLTFYKEIITTTNETRELVLSYPCDERKDHTFIYINGIELRNSYYEFENATTIKISEETNPVPANSTVEIYYVVKPYPGYTTIPQKEITALYYFNNKLFIGTTSRKLYLLENPESAGATELAKFVNLSGETIQIGDILYTTGKIMFSGYPSVKVYQYSLDPKTGIPLYNSTWGVVLNSTNSQAVLVVVIADANGRPLGSNSTISFKASIYKPPCFTINGADSYNATVSNSLYGGEGISLFTLRLAPTGLCVNGTSDALKITIDSPNGQLEYSINVKL